MSYIKNDPSLPCRGDIGFAGRMAIHWHIRIPLWETRLSPAALKKRRNEMTPREFARAYGQRPMADGDLLFSKWIDGAMDPSHTAVERVSKGDYWYQFPRYAGVDLASGSESDQAAYFVVTVVAVKPDGSRWLLWMYRERIRFPDQTRMLVQVHERFQPQRMMVENVGYQQALIDQTIETTDIPVEAVHTGKKEKHDAEIGVPSLEIEFQNRKWHVPQGNEHSQRMFEPLVEEFRDYPTGAFTDTVMATYFSWRGIVGGKKPTPSVGSIAY